MGRTRDLFKKTGHTKGACYAKMGTTKDSKEVTEAEEIKKRWQECTGQLYKKDLDDPDNHHVVVPHLQPDILEYEVKGA